MNQLVEVDALEVQQLADPILVVDDLVPTSVASSIIELVKQPIWKYGWKSNKRKDRFCFWHAGFADRGSSCRDSCEEALAANSSARPIYELWKVLSLSILEGHEPLRVYANSHTYGVEGYVHSDSHDEENYWTTIMYAHSTWHPNWGGETVFFDGTSENIIKAVYPKPGRIVSFPGAIQHMAHAPSRECAELRVAIVFKTQLADA